MVVNVVMSVLKIVYAVNVLVLHFPVVSNSVIQLLCNVRQVVHWGAPADIV